MSILSMSKTVLRSLFSKPATKLYPIAPYKPIEKTRGSLLFDKEKCTYCTLCAKRCPTSAIEVDRTAKTWSIDRLRCISCAYCVEVCPKGCLSMSPTYTSPTLLRDQERF